MKISSLVHVGPWKRRAVAVMLLCVPASALWPQALSGTFTLDQLVEKALSRSEVVAARKEFIEEVKWAGKQAASWKNPSLSVTGGGKQEAGKNGYHYGISVSQPFIFPGKTGIIEDIYNEEEKFAGLSLDEARLFIRHEVIMLAYAYRLAEELEDHLKERVERFRLIEEYIKSRPFVSPKKRAERNIVRSRLRILQKELADLQSEKDILWSKLNLYIDCGGPVAIDVAWFKNGVALDSGTLIESAAAKNIDILKQKVKLEKVNHEIALARKEVYPNVDLMAFYNQEKGFDTEKTFGAGVSMSLPLVNQNSGGVKSLQARARAEKAELDYLDRVVRQQLRALFKGYGIACDNLKRFPFSLLQGAHAQMNDADSEFRKGTIDLLTYLETETQVYDTHLAVFNSQKEYIEKYLAILMLAGRDDFRTEK